MGEAVMRTAGDPYSLRLTPDRTMIKADGLDLSYILVEALDKAGNPCPLADIALEITLTGPAQIVAVGNGDPQSLDSFQGTKVKLFYGKAMIILLSAKKGETKVVVSGAGQVKGSTFVKTGE